MEIVEKRGNYFHILKYTGVFAGVQGVVVLVTVLRNMVVARLLGPQGMGGVTTALGVKIMTAPTHIAGLPVAVNINCHVCRHKTAVI